MRSSIVTPQSSEPLAEPLSAMQPQDDTSTEVGVYVTIPRGGRMTRSSAPEMLAVERTVEGSNLRPAH